MELLKIKPKIKKSKSYRMGLVALSTDFTIEKILIEFYLIMRLVSM